MYFSLGLLPGNMPNCFPLSGIRTSQIGAATQELPTLYTMLQYDVLHIL